MKTDSHEVLVKRALSGELRAARLRSVAWRLLLGLLKDDWLQETNDLRKHYKDLKRSLSVDPRRPLTPPSLDNPLSQHNQVHLLRFFYLKLFPKIYMYYLRTTLNIKLFKILN